MATTFWLVLVLTTGTNSASNISHVAFLQQGALPSGRPGHSRNGGEPNQLRLCAGKRGRKAATAVSTPAFYSELRLRVLSCDHRASVWGRHSAVPQAEAT